MVNLLDETLTSIKRYHKSESDVTWVGSADGKYAISWENFKYIAAKTDYDSGYGGQEIATDLVVVFSDKSWLDRREYDGAEWWAYNTSPVLSKKPKKFFTVKSQSENSWVTLGNC